jgi:hypothetical protein
MRMHIRTVKPDFFRHEGLYELEKRVKLPVRLAFEGLWCAADREGRFEWKPRHLKLDILPWDEINFAAVLDALHGAGFVLRYRVEDREFGVIPSFSEHQQINNKEAASKIPPPSDDAMVPHENSGEFTGITGKLTKVPKGNGMEWNGKEHASLEFERIWKKYPRRAVGKQDGKKRFLEVVRDDEIPQFEQAVERYAAYCKKTNAKEAGIKHMTTFVENRESKPYTQPWRDFLPEPGSGNEPARVINFD